MKVPYKYLVKYINKKPHIDDLSDRLFQLGHEHEICDDVFDFEFTPNRGDCLSINGLLRDLNVFYDVSFNVDIYREEIPILPFEFRNLAEDSCKNISFLKIDIDKLPKNYKEFLEDYFVDLGVKKINFFTDISNYLSYETGQPTHCYDSSKIIAPITLCYSDEDLVFDSLLDKKIKIQEGDLVFKDKNNNVINIAGVVGDKSSSCKKDTKSVIVECAHFNPETIIGKSIQYDVNSEAAYKFERNTDPDSHEFVLRRFLGIVSEHCTVIDAKLFSSSIQTTEKKKIPFNIKKINKIIGVNIYENECLGYLDKLGFSFTNKMITVPSHRNDIKTINDIAEEVARAIGYDNIDRLPFKINLEKEINISFEEQKIKNILIKEGFYEVINNPFVAHDANNSVLVDNPIDSNKKYLRADLKDSLINNLIFNERRQKDCIKLFEISDVYSNKNRMGKKVLGIIASGRIDKNFLDFSKKIDKKYLQKVLSNLKTDQYNIQELSRENLATKSKNQIIYCEVEIDQVFQVDSSFKKFQIKDINDKKYTPISEYPSSFRDLSFSVKDFSKCKILEKLILNYENKLIKDVYVFDYYKNEKISEIKIGFRFIFQSRKSTITDKEVDNVIASIIKDSLSIESVSIPGLL